MRTGYKNYIAGYTDGSCRVPETTLSCFAGTITSLKRFLWRQNKWCFARLNDRLMRHKTRREGEFCQSDKKYSK
jgi:hypothetical protein